MSQSAGAQSSAKVQKVYAGPQELLFSITGVNCPTRKFPIHKERVATDMARPLEALGNISLIRIKLTGPKEKGKQAIKTDECL